MLVRDLGDVFQIVLQPDHAELSGQIAAAWAEDPTLSTAIRDALVLAANRHDDGWAIWERHPRLDARGHPQVFYDVPVDTLLASYRACVEVVSEDSPAAGLLVSMHVSGLRRNRYGVMEAGDAVTPVDELAPAVREFVVFEEQRQEELIAALGFAEPERWRAYWLLQVYDVFSLSLGLADLEHGESRTIPSTPVGKAAADDSLGDPGPLTITPGATPWTVSCEPFPFATDPTRVRMSRRLLPKREWLDESSFRTDFHAAAAEEVEICLVADGGG